MDISTLIKEINSLLENKPKCYMEKVNQSIMDLEEGDLLSIFVGLSDAALENMYLQLGSIRLSEGSIEHLIYHYYVKKVRGVNLNQNDSMGFLINQLITDYEKFKCIALESIVIYLVKHYQLDDEQMDMLSEAFKSSAVVKEVRKLKYRRYIEGGNMLEGNQVSELLDLGAFELIEKALDFNRINHEGLKRIQMPMSGENHKKKKMRLFTRAQALLGKY
jgi:hypothetical protein